MMPDFDSFIQSLKLPEATYPIIRDAYNLAYLIGHDQKTRFGSTCFQEGVELASILSELQMDPDSIAASIIYSTVKNTSLTTEDVEKELGRNVAQLINGMMHLSMINISARTLEQQSTTQIDNIRKMLLAMVQDVRVVVIKLAERLLLMRTLKHMTQSFSEHIAKETMDIFAPLANRLGLHQIKWELEDLAYFYLHPAEYKKIAKQLDEHRSKRETRVKLIVRTLHQILEKAGIHDCSVYGRAKHIYSIIKKMTRKNVDLSEIYDVIAVRVLVPKIEDCYKALSLVHEKWTSIPEEFDDYISVPKPNGYQSIHTAVIDDEGKHFEVQIRTQKMHDSAELGIAAHWIYKEGKSTSSAYERKIAWLRQLLEWQKELASGNEVPKQLEKSLLEERVYVFTPMDEIIDLPNGSTPLDFAYHIHTQIGHRCRGAKIGDKIVPLTYRLKTGDKIEILTTKNGTPSRDWLLPQLGYLFTSTARIKVLQWFKKQDFDKHVAEGRALLEKEIQRLQLPPVNFTDIAHQLNFKSPDQMFAAIIHGNVRTGQILNLIEKKIPQKTETPLFIEGMASSDKMLSQKDIASIDGLDSFLSKVAKCCKPIPGDEIIGFITKTQGISIHRKDCKNIVYEKEHHKERLINISWNEQTQKNLPVDIEIIAYDRAGLLKEITNVFANEKIKILNLNARVLPKTQEAKIVVTIEMNHISHLGIILNQLNQLPNIHSIRRIIG